MPKSAFGVDSLPQEGVSLSLHLWVENHETQQLNR